MDHIISSKVVQDFMGDSGDDLVFSGDAMDECKQFKALRQCAIACRSYDACSVY